MMTVTAGVCLEFTGLSIARSFSSPRTKTAFMFKMDLVRVGLNWLYLVAVSFRRKEEYVPSRMAAMWIMLVTTAHAGFMVYFEIFRLEWRQTWEM